MTAYARRGALLLLGALLVFGLWSTSAQAATRPAQNGSVSKDEAIRQLDVVRESIDRTLALSKAGQSEQAFAEAKAGYLSHFEYVEIPLRVVAPQLTSDAETKFAEIRGLISTGASEGEIRSNIVDLRGLIDDAERHLTDTGIGAPAVVFGQSFLIIFREGLEAVLLVSVLLGYLEAAKATQYRRPIVWGMGVAALATVAHVLPAAHRPRHAPGRAGGPRSDHRAPRGRGPLLRVVLADRAAWSRSAGSSSSAPVCGPRCRSVPPRR